MADIFDEVSGDIFDNISQNVADNPGDNEAINKNFWSAIGAEITPEMREQHPVLSAVAQRGQDIATVGAHFGNQFLLNAPRALLNKAGIDFPENESTFGNVSAKGAGVAGAVLNPLSSIKAISALKAGTKLAPKILQGARAGALQGAAYTPTEDPVGLGQRAVSAGIGAAVGGVGALASESIQKAVREIRKVKAPNKLVDPEGFSRYQIQNVPILKRIGYRIQDVKNKAELLRNSSGLAEKKQLADLENLIAAEETNQKFMNEVTKQSIDDNIASLQSQFKSAYETGAVDIQKKLPAFFRANGKAYAERLDAISDDIGDSFTIGDASNIIEKTINDMTEAGIPESSARSYVSKLSSKYSLQKFDKEGNLIEDLQPHLPANFKNFKNDISSVWKKATTGAKSGAKFSRDDMPALLLQHNFGEYVAKEVPDFVKLQQSYRPVIQAMKQAGKMFKPYASDVENIQGTDLMKRIAEGTATIQEKNLIRKISEGSEFSKGLGDITSEAERIAKNIALLKLNPKSSGNSLKLNSLLEAQNKTKIKLDLIMKRIADDESKSLENLSIRKRKADILVENKNRAAEYRKNAMAGGAVLAGLLGLGTIGNTIMRERLIK